MFTCYDLYVAYGIVKSDDVSGIPLFRIFSFCSNLNLTDSFIDPMTYSVHSVRWYDRFCFFKAVESNTENYSDQAVIFAYRTLYL